MTINPGDLQLLSPVLVLLGAAAAVVTTDLFSAKIERGALPFVSLGGTIAVIAVFIKNELMLLLLGGVFVVETLSVILQITSFKLRRKRIFRMSPLHHHLQLGGWNESKIIVRFWIIGIILALLTLVTLKVR